MTLRPGDLAPEAVLLDSSGAEASLGVLLRGEATVTIFLRHLA